MIRRPRPSVVYFLQVETSGPVKIGCTTGDVYTRVRALQQASPYVLRWIGFFVGTRADERAAHNQLAAHRLRNEWFHPHPDVIAFVRVKCPEFSAKEASDQLLCEPERRIVFAAIPRYARSNERSGVVEAIAGAAGIRPYDLYAWISRNRLPDPEVARRAAAYVVEHLTPPEPERARA